MDTPWHSNKYDLIISTIIALLFPFLASLLYKATGALIPMIVYYGLAWGIVIWRRKSSGYTNKSKKLIPVAFIINVVVVGAALVLAYFARNTEVSPRYYGSYIYWSHLGSNKCSIRTIALDLSL